MIGVKVIRGLVSGAALEDARELVGRQNHGQLFVGNRTKPFDVIFEKVQPLGSSSATCSVLRPRPGGPDLAYHRDPGAISLITAVMQSPVPLLVCDESGNEVEIARDPGDCVILDNSLVMHRRDGFPGSHGVLHVLVRHGSNTQEWADYMQE